MTQPVDQQRMISRRAFVFGGAATAAMSVLLGRLYFLQFLKSDEFGALAEDNRVKLQLVAPIRGMILDRLGIPLATNEKNFRILLDVETRRDFAAILTSLSELIPLSKERIKLVLAQAKSRKYQPPILIKEHLSWDELSQFEYYAPQFPGVFVDVGQVRNYPFKDHAAHLIGYVGTISETEMKLEDEKALARLPDFKVGKGGMEKFLEPELRGVAGFKHVEVNVHNLPVRELSNKPGIPGKDTRITIDSRLQEFASTRLGSESAGLVVMDVHNGDILSLVSMPGFDPNRFSLGITNEYWAELQSNERNPLMNKAITGQYPPGSTFKMLVGLAALEAGVANPNTHVYCPGHFFLGNHQFNCWKAGGHGSMNLHHAIAQSCDTYFYTMAQRLGIDKIADMARRYGLGAVHDIGIVGEKPGIVPDNAWKRARYNDAWRPGDTINAGIGQGYVLSTPLQLAVMTARMCNGGKAVKPRLYKPQDETQPPTFESTGCSQENLKAVVEGMIAVNNSPYGTAYRSRIDHPVYSIAGKTGTSQVRKITVRGQDQSKIPWRFRHHAWFVAFAPAIDPKYALGLIVEHGGGGASAAAPVAHDIMLKLQEIMDVSPKQESVAPKGVNSSPAATGVVETDELAPEGDSR
jgi:penicillin-binding protein 2